MTNTQCHSLFQCVVRHQLPLPTQGAWGGRHRPESSGAAATLTSMRIPQGAHTCPPPPPQGPFPWGSRTFSSPFVQPAPLCPPAPKQTMQMVVVSPVPTCQPFLIHPKASVLSFPRRVYACTPCTGTSMTVSGTAPVPCAFL